MRRPMTHILDWNDLRKNLSLRLEDLTPQAAEFLVLRLGGLARWCLRPEVLHIAVENDAVPESYREAWQRLPELPATHGSCWVIFATDTQARLPLMRPAFVLPLRWVQGQTHSPQLPAALVQMAARTVASFAEHPRINGFDWGLQLALELHDTVLAGLPLECDSGWASLAAGLLVAAGGGTPDLRVWSTGSWSDDGGIQPVGFLEQKVALAEENGAAVLFVPSVQADQAATLSGGIEVGRLQMAEREPSRALAELTQRLEAPPPPPANMDDQKGFQRCVDYYLKQPRSVRGTRDFYLSHLFPAVAQRCRHQVRIHWPECQPTHLVTIVSRNPDLVRIGARAAGVSRTLLLYTPDPDDPRRDQTAAMESVQALLEADGVECVPGAFDDSEALAEQIPRIVKRFVAGVPAEEVVLDITPGGKWMTWVADRAMPPGSWRLYLRNDTLTTPDHRPRPGTEQLVCWRV